MQAQEILYHLRADVSMNKTKEEMKGKNSSISSVYGILMLE